MILVLPSLFQSQNQRLFKLISNFSRLAFAAKYSAMSSNLKKVSKKFDSDNGSLTETTQRVTRSITKHVAGISNNISDLNGEARSKESTAEKRKRGSRKFEKPSDEVVKEETGTGASASESSIEANDSPKSVKKRKRQVKAEESPDKTEANKTKDGTRKKVSRKQQHKAVVKDEKDGEDNTDQDYEPEQQAKKRNRKANNKKNDNEEQKPKPEMKVISEFLIPQKTETIKRPKGPSPYNGTISFTGKMYIGAHVSAAGGLENAVTNAVEIGAKSFALFLRSQRQWVAKPMEESTVEKFKAACLEHGISPHLILPHGSYLMNLGSPDESALAKSRTLLLDELQRCDRLGLLYYNIHPGSSCGQITREESIQRIADSINWAHSQTPGSRVSVVLENMCRQGSTLGGDLSDLADIIERVIDQSRVGVCLDTCHALAAGYNLATPEGLEKFVEEFELVVGFRYLVAVHLNDSEGPLGCHRDRHASIGKGHIGKKGFENIVNCPRFRDIPVILETPYVSPDTYRNEISLLSSMIKKTAISE